MRLDKTVMQARNPKLRNVKLNHHFLVMERDQTQLDFIHLLAMIMVIIAIQLVLPLHQRTKMSEVLN